MRFEVLGSVRVVHADGATAAPRARKPRTLLALLLLHANEWVRVDRIVDALWAGDPPASAAGNIKTYVWNLRQFLPDPARIASDRNSYRIMAGRGELDVFRFEDRVSDGERAWAEGRRQEAVEALSEALSWWRGAPFEELDGADADAVRARLTERNLAARETLAHVLVAGHRDEEAIAVLRGIAAEHPFRERVRGLLMTALHQAGRSAEALAVYEDTRALLDRELGVLPGAELRRVHTAILRQEPVMVTSPPSAVESPPEVIAPAQLPAPPSGFVGREETLRAMDDERVLVLTGMAGVGKTALALHWAHRQRSRFPGGQLFVNLRGHSAVPPLTPRQALDELLHALGVEQTSRPTSVDGASAAFRSAVAGREILVLLDDATDAAQVRPLLPGTSDCAVLITSRNRLDGLVANEGARQLSLETLGTSESRAVLGAIIGAGRLAAEPEAAKALAALCGGLPLALRIAAAHVAGRRGSISDYVAALEKGDRLAALELHGDPDSAVGAAIDLSYEAQPASARRLFRLMGLVPGPDITAPAVAELAGVDLDEAERGLRGLTAANLVDEHVHGRYAMHELLRVYAAARATEDGDEPLQRLLSWYAESVAGAADTLDGGRVRVLAAPPCPPSRNPARFADASVALGWLKAEAPSITALIEHDRGRLAWYLADSLRGFFIRGHTTHWARAVHAALPAAEADTENPKAAVVLHSSAGVLYLTRGEHRTAVRHLELSLERSGNWTLGRTIALSNLGVVHFYTGSMLDALEYLRQADEAARDDPACGTHQGIILINLAATTLRLGRTAETLDHLDRSLAAQETSGHDRGRAMTLLLLAETHFHAGELDRAEHLAGLVADVRPEAVDVDEAVWRLQLGARIAIERGNPMLAKQLLDQTVTVGRASDMMEVSTQNTIAALYVFQGRLDEAAQVYQDAYAAARRAHYIAGQIDALIGQATVWRRLDRPADALDRGTAALRLIRVYGHYWREGTVHAALRLRGTGRSNIQYG